MVLPDATMSPDDEAPGLFDVLVERFAELGGVDLELPARMPPRAILWVAGDPDS